MIRTYVKPRGESEKGNHFFFVLDAFMPWRMNSSILSVIVTSRSKHQMWNCRFKSLSIFTLNGTALGRVTGRPVFFSSMNHKHNAIKAIPSILLNA